MVQWGAARQYFEQTNQDKGDAMPETPQVIKLELRPIPPDTIASAKEELMPLIEAALREAGRSDLLSDEHIQVQVEKTFPTDDVIIVGLVLLSGIALETYKALILPVLKRKFKVRQKSKRKKESAKK
jgi:hypothetical protein